MKVGENLLIQVKSIGFNESMINKNYTFINIKGGERYGKKKNTGRI